MLMSVNQRLILFPTKMAESTMRPNIRIEIHNNLVEKMDVDSETKIDEEEEGEISDSNDLEDKSPDGTQKQKIRTPIPPTHRIWPNANGGFTTGINIFDKKEQVKLVERAKRFALDLSDLNNFTDQQLQQLHDSLGITAEEEKEIRFQAIHMRGTEEMSTEDIFKYFGKYGPAGVEWINDESCNVVWNDKVSAARALFFLSKPIKGMPVEGSCDPFAKELEPNLTEDKENEGRSVLLKNKDRDVELSHEDKDDASNETASVTDITVPIPPGYWRLGVPCLKSKFILMRFALKSDKKPMKAEKFSEYYKKHGNPNFGGMKGIITETRKQKFKGIFDRNRDIQKEKKEPEDRKNPWGALAMNWDEDSQYCEREVGLPANLANNLNAGKSGIMSRLGFKRSLESENDSVSQDNQAEKKTKVPRMRMYADEEEEKIKRRRRLLEMKIRSELKEEVVNDLRNVIKVAARKGEARKEVVEDENDDLGSKLKNRNRRLDTDRVSTDRHRNRTERKPVEEEVNVRQHIKPEEEENQSRNDKHRRDKSSHRYEKRLHSDRCESRRRHESYDDAFANHKPKSKIAVVIKTQKRPMVASTVWSRINSERERLKTMSEGKLRIRRESTSSSEESYSSAGRSSSSASESSDAEESSNESQLSSNKAVKVEKPDRPGFKGDGAGISFEGRERRSPLRIEISNDHFKRE